MLTGVKFKANPTKAQKEILSQWMGCARVIWNAKCQEERYYSTFARKYRAIGTFAPIDQKYSHFKSRELTSYLYECPSQILRNSATNWYETFSKYKRKLCGKPRFKPKTDKGSVHLTRELFSLVTCKDGVVRLKLGTQKFDLGFLSFKKHKDFKEPKSIYIKRECGEYHISFCYENVSKNDTLKKDEKAHLNNLKRRSEVFLNRYTIGIDRGIKIAIQASNDTAYDFTENQSKNLSKHKKKIKYLQRCLAKQKNKQSNHRKRTKQRLSKAYCKIKNIRRDLCHTASDRIIKSHAKIIILENLKTVNMTKSAKGTIESPGKNVKAKSGLNREILNKGWHLFESFLQYKALKAGKVVFKVPAPYTSQTCAKCDHTNPANRKTQSRFECVSCGHIDNADKNASCVIRNRAIKLIKDSETELVGKGIPTLSATGRGAVYPRKATKRSNSDCKEASKKKEERQQAGTVA